MKTIKLLKVTLQPTFIIVDTQADEVEELVIEPLVIKSKDWEEFKTVGFEKAIADLRETIQKEDNVH